ncbi:MAG: GNAT family N-acetyltransferase [Clostridiales bacterium]|nr:GNAT family N-acetyltransferase [Clostridiales bacterium]
MTWDIVPAAQQERDILDNLLEKYLYEFSWYDNDSVNERGRFGYPPLDWYFTQPDRDAFLFYADGKLAGFAMVNDHPEVLGRPFDHSMAEFFVLPAYRRCGLGSYAAKWLFDAFRGHWQVKYHPKNTASVSFWNRVVKDYTGGRYECLSGCQACEPYADGTRADVLCFQT